MKEQPPDGPRRLPVERDDGSSKDELLVIFDCDGVLVDSERIANPLLAEMLTEIGLHTTPAESVENYQGRAWRDCARLIEERLGGDLPSDFHERFQQRLMAAFAQRLDPIPGLKAALRQIVFPVCVASSSGHVHIRNVLEWTGLLDRFEGHCFSASDVSRGKPDPDLFLYAAKQMGFSPEASVVVEDSVFGVQGACAAGMRVLGFARDTDARMLAEAGAEIFHDMKELPALLLNADAHGASERLPLDEPKEASTRRDRA